MALTPEALQVIEQAFGYAYFSLTLLNTFTAKDLTQRAVDAAARGEGGE
ncbi:hypothetical protein ACWGH5_37000 [Streptomyces sp. NPDC054864]